MIENMTHFRNNLRDEGENRSNCTSSSPMLSSSLFLDSDLDLDSDLWRVLPLPILTWKLLQLMVLMAIRCCSSSSNSKYVIVTAKRREWEEDMKRREKIQKCTVRIYSQYVPFIPLGWKEGANVTTNKIDILLEF